MARAELKFAPWNPEIRIQMDNLKDLRESMAHDGFWEFCPILVDRNGFIIDGHRRAKTAQLLQIEQVPATIVDMDAQELWAAYNGTRMDLTGAQAMQAIANGLTARPAKYAKRIAKLEDVLGTEGLKELGRQGKSPFLINTAIRIARYCSLDDDKPYMALVVWWLVSHARMSSVTARAIQDNIDPAVIERAVRAGRPLDISYR